MPIKCTRCGVDRDPSWFSKDWRRRRNGHRTPWCKPCLRAASRLRRTGLTQEEFDKLLADHQGRCGICGVAFDDDHPPRIDRSDEGLVRGLLCARCKVALSTLQCDVDRLQAAVEYLGRVTLTKP